MVERPSRFPREQRGSLASSLEEDSGWSITLSDIALLLLCALLVWHVVEKRQITQSSHPPESTPIPANSVLPAPAAANPIDGSPVPRISRPSGEFTDVTGIGESAFSGMNQWGVLKSELEQYVSESGLRESIGVVSRQHELLVALKDTVLFASGEADLQASSTPIFEKVAALARSHPDLALEVLGHTDDVPIATSAFPSNWELSAARASRVARRLIDAGVTPTSVSAQGYASFRPLVPNTSDENRASNRRVEIRFYRRVENAAVDGQR